jgi:hypothetical protein
MPPPRWLGLRRTASPRVWLPGSVPHGAPAHLLGAAAIAVVVGNRRAHHLWSVIPAVPRCTPVLAAHQLQTSIPASTSRLVRRCTPAPAATHPKTAIPADTPHKCIEVQLVPIGLIVVSTARNRGPRCRHHNCFADDREARRQDRFYQSGDEFEDGVAHRQNPSRRHLSKEACLPRRFPSPWSVEEPDPKLDRRCFIVRHANGRALAYVYFEEERGRRAAAGPPIAALGIRKRL